MKLHIPALGERLTLTADWTFRLFRSQQTIVYMRTIGLEHPLPSSLEHTLPAGTVLKVERIYIRQHKSEYDSVTFRIDGQTNSRFWARLADANRIEFA